MSEPSEQLRILAREAELIDVCYDLMSAELRPDPAGEAAAPEFALSIRRPEAGDEEPGERRHWQYGLRVKVATGRGVVVVEPVATYAVDVEHQDLLVQPTLTEFANEVGVMALLPYARQALQDLAGQVLREQIVMPSFPRGAVTFPPPSASDTPTP